MQPGNQQSPEFMNLYNTLQQQVQLHGKPGEFDMLRDNPAAYFQIQKGKSQSKLAGPWEVSSKGWVNGRDQSMSRGMAGSRPSGPIAE